MREFVIWSKFGLWRTVTEEELPHVVEAAEHAVYEVDNVGFFLTRCDVEPVVLFAQYPDELPAEALEWLDQPAP